MKSDHAVLITVYDVNPDVNASIAEQYNIKAARSLADFLDKDINFLKDYGDNLPILL
jgi:predicted dehydrogenase